MAEITVREAIPVQKTTSQTHDVYENKITVGAGTVGPGGAVPDPINYSYEAISQSLSKFFPTLTGDKIDVLIAEASLKLKDIVGRTEVNELNAMEEQKRQNAAEQRAAAEEAQKSLEEAQAAREKSKKSGLMGRIFGAISAAVSIVVGAALIMTGVGAVAGGLLLASGIVGALATLGSFIREEHGVGLLGFMAKRAMEDWTNLDAETIERRTSRWDKAGTALAITTMLVLAVASMGYAAYGIAGAGQAAAAGAKTASLTDDAVQLTKETMTTAEKWAGFINKGSVAVDTAMTGVEVGYSVHSAVQGYLAAKDQADAQRNQADNLQLQALNELLDDFIDQILARISGTNTLFNAMLDEVVQSIKDRGDTLARAKFSV
ncbi:MAG: type III secretion system translocon subunit SctE [Pseudomonadota bacterium]